MGRLTTHVLDTVSGTPARGMSISLWRLDGERPGLVRTVVTNVDGRVDGPVLEGEAFTAGVYELRFLAGDYFRGLAIDGSAADGFSVAPPPSAGDARRVPHPLAAFRQRIRLTGRWQAVPEKMFIYATGWAETPFTAQYERLKAEPGWSVKTLPCGHDIFGKAPEDFLRLVQELNGVGAP